MGGAELAASRLLRRGTVVLKIEIRFHDFREGRELRRRHPKRNNKNQIYILWMTGVRSAKHGWQTIAYLIARRYFDSRYEQDVYKMLPRSLMNILQGFVTHK